MKEFLNAWLSVLLVTLSGCATAGGGSVGGVVIHPVSDADHGTRFEVVVENTAKEQRRISVAIELNDQGNWAEYPHRIEDSQIAMQRPKHALAPGARQVFVWDTARDLETGPELPAGTPAHKPTLVTARIRVSVFDASGGRQFVYSDPFPAKF